MGQIQNPLGLVRDFAASESAQRLQIRPVEIACPPMLRGPHEPPKLPQGKGAVYVFALGREYGQACSAGPGFVLKVGRVGPNSNPRFQSQHYQPWTAQSTLGGSLVAHEKDWDRLGITSPLAERTVGSWMKRALDRQHFLVDAADCGRILKPLEDYLHEVLDPLYEGAD